MVQFWGKLEVRWGSVKVESSRKFCTIRPREEKPVSRMYRASPPKISTKAMSPKNR